MARIVINITPGARFNRLTAIRCAGSNSGHMWLFECTCGKRKKISVSQVVRGDSVSCGCYRRERSTKHGACKRSASPTIKRMYSAFVMMHQRCKNPKNHDWPNYGARGIRVCRRWSGGQGFSHFLEDMGERPQFHSLDRINVDGHYEPSNCRWATAYEQRINQRAMELPAPGVAW